MTDEYRVGDAVVERASGRRMTVAEVHAPVFRHRYLCVWEEDGVRNEGLFKAGEVEPAAD